MKKPLIAALLCGVNWLAHAAYPDKPITLVVPYPPGGATDILARKLAGPLGQRLGQSVIVENRAGASGMIGAELVAKSPPDGHMLLANSSIHVIVPSLFSKMTYDPVRDFIPVTVVSSSPLMLVVTPALPVKNIKGFIALAKARPGDMSFGSSGAGSSTHLTAELLKSVTNTNMVHNYYGAMLSLSISLALVMAASEEAKH